MDRNSLSAPAPALAFTPAITRGIADSAAYLDSDAALRSIAVDPYWPKWDAPWWHMLLLFELGEASRIPARAAQAMCTALDALPLHLFPIRPGEAPPGTDPHRDFVCHCALGCMVQVLPSCGIDVARALPWASPWFSRYQMADGGLNCDEQAYLCTDACPSSMVGTIAPLEALLGRAGSDAERAFVARGAQFLIGRALVQGSQTVQNADERTAARAWPEPCFPRFYFYDVLRGLSALVRWAEGEGAQAVLPRAAVEPAVTALLTRFPDGVVCTLRHAHAGKTTILPTTDRTPSPRAPASGFALLEAASVLGAPSVALTRQWSQARHGLVRLLDAGRIA